MRGYLGRIVTSSRLGDRPRISGVLERKLAADGSAGDSRLARESADAKGMNPVIVRMFTQPRAPAETDAPSSASIAAPQPTVSSLPAKRSAGQVGSWLLGRKRSEHDGVAVFEARNERTPDERAPYIVKIVRRTAPTSALEALRREAAAAREVNDSHVVWVAATQLRDPPYYVVMPRLRGRTLAESSAGDKRPSIATALWFARQAAQGLAALHARGWLHGDVKPENLLVSPQGHVTLLDLGCARRIDVRETGDGESSTTPYLAGTIDYLAPEAFCSRLRIDARSDLYSLGLVLYEMLAGRVPGCGQPAAEIISARLTAAALDPRSVNVKVPLEVSQLVAALTAREPLRRPQSADEAVRRLSELEIAFLTTR